MRYRPDLAVKTTTMDDGGLVLLSERSGTLYRCNPTAAAMWTALLAHNGQPDLAAATVAEQYRTDPACVRADLSVLVDQLWAAGLVEVDG